MRWAALVFNFSDSIRPVTNFDLLGRPLDTQEGVGQDYGACCFLFESRLVVGVTRYSSLRCR